MFLRRIIFCFWAACALLACGSSSADHQGVPPETPEMGANGSDGGITSSDAETDAASAADSSDGATGDRTASADAGEAGAESSSTPHVARVEITPAGLVLRPGETATLTVHVWGDGDAGITDQAVTWAMTGAAVTTQQGANQTVTVTAGNDIASTVLVARVGGVSSAPVTIAVAELVDGVRLLRDDEVLGEVKPVDNVQSGGPGSQIHVVIAGDAPPAGQILVGSGTPVEGKVVSSTPAASGNDVVLEIVPLDEVFVKLRIEQTYDVNQLAMKFPSGAPTSSTANADGSTTYQFALNLPDYTPPQPSPPTSVAPNSITPQGLGATIGQSNFMLGPMFCAAAADVSPSISASQIVTTVTPHLASIEAHIIIDPTASSFKVLANGSVDAKLDGPFRVSTAFKGSLLCQAPLVHFEYPMPPPIIFWPAVVVGARLSASGSVLINNFELKVDATVSQPVKLGLEVLSDGTVNNLSEVDFSKITYDIKGELRSTTPNSPARVQAELRGGGYVQGAITNPVFAFVSAFQNKYPFLSMLDLEAGLKADLSLGTVADQVNDPSFTAGYDAKFHVRAGLGDDAAEVLSWLSKLLKLGTKLIPEYVNDTTLFSNPIGEAQTSLTTYIQGDHVHYSVALDPDYIQPPLLGYYNVKRVEIWRKKQNGGAEMLIGRDALNGEKDFSFDWTADRGDVTTNNVVAVVEPVFGEGFEFKIGPVAGWTQTQQFGGTNDEVATAPTIDPKGNIAFIGYTLDGLQGFTKPGGADVVWMKVDPTGKLISRALIGGAGDDFPLDMKLSADGYYYVCGYSTGGDFSGEGFPTPNVTPWWPGGTANVYAWLMKLDADGKRLWAHQWVERQQEAAISIGFGPNGEIYVGGNTGVSLTVSPTANNCPNVVEPVYPLPNSRILTEIDCGDVVLSEFNPGGVMLFHTVDNARSWQTSGGIAVDPSGNAIALRSATYGNIESTDPVAQAYGNRDEPVINTFVYKSGAGIWIFDPSGQVRTRQYIKIDHADVFVSSIAYDSNSNLYIAGKTTGAFDGWTNKGGNDIYLLPLNGTAQMFGTPDEDTMTAMRIGPKGDIFLTGTTAGSLFGTPSGGVDSYLLHLAPTGNVIASLQFGSSGDDVATGVALDTYGSAFVAGSTSGKLGSVANGGRDQFVAKISPSGVLQ